MVSIVLPTPTDIVNVGNKHIERNQFCNSVADPATSDGEINRLAAEEFFVKMKLIKKITNEKILLKIFHKCKKALQRPLPRTPLGELTEFPRT